MLAGEAGEVLLHVQKFGRVAFDFAITFVPLGLGVLCALDVVQDGLAFFRQPLPRFGEVGAIAIPKPFSDDPAAVVERAEWPDGFRQSGDAFDG